MVEERINVLLVEDDPVDAEVVDEVLREADSEAFAVTRCESLNPALQRLERGGVDVVLLDLRLPGTSGMEALAETRRRAPDVPVVVLTGLDDDDLALSAVREGAQDYLVKGAIEPVKLARVLRCALERHRKLEVLGRTSRSFRDVIELEREGVALVRGGRVVFANRAALDCLGVADPADLVGRPVPDVLRAPGAPAPEETPGLGIAGAVSERPYLTPSEDERILEVAFGSRMEFEGAPARLVLIRDLTAKRGLEERLFAEDRLAALGLLAAGISHEVNNPLTYILGYADLLASKLATVPECCPEDVDLWLSGIRDGAERIRSMVERLRVFARPEPGKVDLLDLPAVVDGVLEILEHQVRHVAALETRLDPVPRVRASEPPFAQVVFHLVVDAMHALSEERSRSNRITISTRPSAQGGAVLEVRDNGPAIPPESLPRVFDPFFVARPGGFGTGLGLAIARSIVTSFGGRMEVESAAGETMFRVVMPPPKEAEGSATLPVGGRLPVGVRAAAEAVVAPAATPAPAAPRGTPPDKGDPLRRARVLLVEDEALVRALMESVLEDAFDVIACAGGREALDVLGADAGFDAIVCDLMMPGMNGADLYEEVEARYPGLQESFIFVTGGAFTDRAQRFLEAISNPCLQKPLDVDELEALIRQRVGAS